MTTLSLGFGVNDVLSTMNVFFEGDLGKILAFIIALAVVFLLARKVITIPNYSAKMTIGDRIRGIGDNVRVWNWRRKGWMEKDSLRFTDKMTNDFLRRRSRRMGGR